MFEVPTSIITNLLANLTNQLADGGTLLVLVLAAGIPLAFYVIRRLINLIPKDKPFKEVEITDREMWGTRASATFMEAIRKKEGYKLED
jgi:flagellar biogenesis protein FliO